MRLICDGQTIDNPTSADLSRAFGPGAPPDGWSIELIRGEGDSIEADWAGNGRYQVAYVSGKIIHDGTREVDAHELRELLTRYLQGDPRWRAGLEWREYKGAPAATTSGVPSMFRTIWPVLIIPAVLVVFFFGGSVADPWLRRIPWPSLPLPPWMDSTPARVVLGVFAALVALVLVAAIAKHIEVRRASRWPKTMGRIVRSQQSFVPTGDTAVNTPNHRRIADIAYEYQVAGQTFQRTRVSFAERIPEDEVPALIARYPVGRAVEVFYDPRSPGKATLERELPKGVGLGCLALLGIGCAVIAVLMVLATHGPAWITQAFPKAIVPLVLMFGIGALMLGLIALATLKETLRARHWPTTPATVRLSEVRSHTTKEAIIPVVEYTYTVAGREYRSHTIRLDGEVSGSNDYAAGVASRYPVGKIIQARYDPANPARSTLELRYGLASFLLALGAVLLVLTAWAAGLLTEGPPLQWRR